MNNLNAILKKIKHGGVKSLVRKALEKKIDAKIFLNDPFVIKLTHKEKSVIIRGGSVPLERKMGNMTKNKNLTKIILEDAGIKVPKGFVAGSLKEALSFLKKSKLKFPLIAKPLNDSLARGVTWNINSTKELKKAINFLYKNKSLKLRKYFLVEEMFVGEEFRILIFDGKVVSCVKKIPASVVGDGKSTIMRLIEMFNRKRMKGFEIKIDKIVKKNLKMKKLKLNSILPDGYVLKLRNNLNMSDGGRAVDCTQEINKRFKQICERAAEVVNLSYCGIDLLTKNISLGQSPYVVIEINSNPYYNMHEKPLVEGKGIDLSSKILKKLFPGLK